MCLHSSGKICLHIPIWKVPNKGVFPICKVVSKHKEIGGSASISSKIVLMSGNNKLAAGLCLLVKPVIYYYKLQ